MPRQRRTRIRPEATRPRVAGPWKHGPIPVIGLIGGIGAGKTRVSALLAEQGAFVIDADAVGHALLDQRPVRDQVVARFGKEILHRTPGDGPEDAAEGEASPTIDRLALGAIVFADPAALRQLEAILHPKMRRTFERAIARTVRRGRARAVVLDAAILLEAGWDSLCDRILFVDAPRDIRLARLSATRGWSDETLARREAAQWPLDRKRDRADLIVLNNDDTRAESLVEEIRRVVDPLFPRPAGATQSGPVVASATGSNRSPNSPPSGDASRSRSGFGRR
jgi:dephospho-CoA kinase